MGCGLEHLTNCHGEWTLIFAALIPIKIFWNSIKIKAILAWGWIKDSFK